MVTLSATGTGLDELLVEVAEQLQLPLTLDGEVRTHYSALTDYLAGSAVGAFSPSLYAQGSFRIGTTVKPISEDEFDLDFVCELHGTTGMGPQDVYELVAKAIEVNGTYQDKTKRKDRCVRVHFARNCHLDIVPAVELNDPSDMGAIAITDGKDGSWKWKSTNPRGYVRWFESLRPIRTLAKAAQVEPLPPQEGIEIKSALQVGVQLLKRNHQKVVVAERLRTPSIVLTTIAGQASGGAASVRDVVSASVSSIEAYASSAAPRHLTHPVHAKEIISERWNDTDVYRTYRDYAGVVANQWSAVLAAEGRGYHVVAPLLNEMFGEAPVQAALRAVGERTRILKEQGRLRTAVTGGLVATTAGLGNPKNTYFGDDNTR